MENKENDGKDMEEFSEIQTAFQDILDELKDLHHLDSVTPHQHCPSSEQVDILKDQITFLARRILILHNKQEKLNDQINRLEEESSGNGNLATEQLPNIERTADSGDSGCLTNSSESASSKFQSEPNLALHDDSHESVQSFFHGDTQESVTSTAAEDLANLQYLTGQKLTLKLIHIETEYTQLLRSALENTERKTFNEISLIKHIYVRHKALVQQILSLTIIRNGHKNDPPTTIDNLVLQLLRFWCDQDLIHAYNTILRDPHRGARVKVSGSVTKDGPTTAKAGVAQIIWKHVQFLSVYLRGVRDTLSRNDPHFEHLISVLVYLSRETHAELEDSTSLQLCTQVPGTPQVKLVSKADQHTQTSSDLSTCKVSFMEGTAYVTILRIESFTATATATGDTNLTSFTVAKLDTQILIPAGHICSKQVNRMENPFRLADTRTTSYLSRKNAWKNDLWNIIKRSFH